GIRTRVRGNARNQCANGRVWRPQRDTEVGAHEIRPLYVDCPAWLGGMTQEEAGLALTMVTVA
ncbi:MAG TPA: hypothetical protein VF765_10515, partial [Polyangiaceae bacterium]